MIFPGVFCPARAQGQTETFWTKKAWSAFETARRFLEHGRQCPCSARFFEAVLPRATCCRLSNGLLKWGRERWRCRFEGPNKIILSENILIKYDKIFHQNSVKFQKIS
jgi:hypothetical protein